MLLPNDLVHVLAYLFTLRVRGEKVSKPRFLGRIQYKQGVQVFVKTTNIKN